MTVAWEVVIKKRNQWECWLYRVAIDYFIMAPSVAKLDEETLSYEV